MLLLQLHVPCSSSYGDSESNVFIILVHTVHTQNTKKKIALVIRGCHRNEEVQ
jgi:hypothetical protein